MMRTFLDEGAITFEGDFFQLQRALHLRPPRPGAHPDQDGRHEGPALVPDGGRDRRRHAPGARVLARGLRVHRRRTSGSAPTAPAATGSELDIGAWVVTVVSEDSAAAKQAARILVAFYISSMPAEQLARHGIDAEELAPVVEALGARRRRPARSAVRAAVRGEARRRGHARGGRREDQGRHRAGRREPHDPGAGRPRAGQALHAARTCRTCPTSSGQLKLVAERVMPAFG